jgi:hypothetical protein
MLSRKLNRDGNGAMTDNDGRHIYTKLCKILAIFLLPGLFGAGCGLDKGSSGDIPPQVVFLEDQGCLADNPVPGQAGTIVYSDSFPAPRDLSLMEARLEVLRGELDIVVGTENPPSDYFALGRGPGAQKIRVGRDSREPMGELRPWFVQLVSPFEIQECEEGEEPDWRLSVRRSSGTEGRVLLDQDGQAPACIPGICVPEEIPIEVPEDALSMEIALESTEEGDADLLVGFGSERESLVSLNPGPGFDVVVIDQDRLVPLRGQSVVIRLESWQAPTDYRLQVAYTRGEPEEAPL